MTPALVLAAPERLRILRELLAETRPWSPAQRELYAQMIAGEFRATNVSRDFLDQGERDATAGRICGQLLVQGVPLDEAKTLADEKAASWWEESTGTGATARRLRRNRKLQREAVTESRGGDAVTLAEHNVLRECVVCGVGLRGYYSQEFHRQLYRRWTAYCSSKCRQKAYRLRRAAS